MVSLDIRFKADKVNITYDNADRLTELIRNVPVGTDTTWRYWYDQAGNRTFDDTIKYPGGPDVRTHTLNLLDQVTYINSTNPAAPDTGLTYDANGNMTSAAVTYPGVGTFTAYYDCQIRGSTPLSA